MRKLDEKILQGKDKSKEGAKELRREYKIIPSKTAAFLIRWQWIPMLISAPLSILPSPLPLIPIVVVVAIWLTIWMWGGEPLVRTPLNIPILIIAIMILVSTWATYDLKVSLGYVAGAVLGLAAFFTISRYGGSIKGWWICFSFYVGLNIIIVTVVSFMVHWPQKVAALLPITSRLTSPVITLPNLLETPHPNTIPAILLGILPLLMVFSAAVLLQRKIWTNNIGPKRTISMMLLLLVLTIVSGFVLLLSQSRGGYIAFTVTCLFLLLIILKPHKRWILLGSLAAASLVMVILGQRGLLLQGHEEIASTSSNDLTLSMDSLQVRLEIWSRAIYGIQDFPFTGMGMNTFGHVFPVWYPLFTVRPDVVTLNAHNTFLQAALDLGIPGLIAFLGVQIGTLWMLRKLWRAVSIGAGNPLASGGFGLGREVFFLTKPIILGLGGGIIAYLVFGLTESLEIGVYILVWPLIGLIFGLFRQLQSLQQT